MVTFIDAHRAAYGVEPICAQLPIAPTTYYEAKARVADPTRHPARVQRDQGAPARRALLDRLGWTDGLPVPGTSLALNDGAEQAIARSGRMLHRTHLRPVRAGEVDDLDIEVAHLARGYDGHLP
jgi:hypothetical protein